MGGKEACKVILLGQEDCCGDPGIAAGSDGVPVACVLDDLEQPFTLRLSLTLSPGDPQFLPRRAAVTILLVIK